MFALFMGMAMTQGCGASFVGPATNAAPGSCDGHLKCDQGCCTEAGSDGEGWTCGSSAFEGCPEGSCCFTGQDIGSTAVYGRKERVFKLVTP
jgi:hypothetical protein